MRAHSPRDHAKIAAGRYAAERYCASGMTIGLGSGTTARFFVQALAEKVRAGLDMVGVPSSRATETFARALGIRLIDLDDAGELDVCIDGLDEIDARGRMIKGAGGCLLWEKIVARSSRRMVVLADDSKFVDTLGYRTPTPVEIVPFGHKTTTRLVIEMLREAGYGEATSALRVRKGEPLLTDSGNYIVDFHLDAVRDAERLTVELNRLPGVVENGLFVGIARELVIGHPDGSAKAYSLPLVQPRL